MDAQKASQFISSLIKSLQVVCHGHVDFQHNIEIVGHIYLHVDKSQKFNYVLNEEVCKDDESSTKFISNSFHAEPPSREPDRKRKKTAQLSTRSEPDDNSIFSIELDSSLNVGNAFQQSASVPLSILSTSRLQHKSFGTSLPSSKSSTVSESVRSPKTEEATKFSNSVHMGAQSLDLHLDKAKHFPKSGHDRLSPKSRPVLQTSSSVSSIRNEPEVEIKLEVPSEEEVQILSEEIADYNKGPNLIPYDNNPLPPPAALVQMQENIIDHELIRDSGHLYPVMLHENLAAHERLSAASSGREDIQFSEKGSTFRQGNQGKRPRVESDVMKVASSYALGNPMQDMMQASASASTSSGISGSHWSMASSNFKADAKSITLSDNSSDTDTPPMVHFESDLISPHMMGAQPSVPIQASLIPHDSDPNGTDNSYKPRIPWCLPASVEPFTTAQNVTSDHPRSHQDLNPPYKMNMLEDSSPELYHCRLCMYSTKYAGNLSKHMQSCHSGVTPQSTQSSTSLPSGRFTCHTCNKSFKTQHGKKCHEDSQHLNIFRYVCPICKKGYQGLWNYKGHIASHDTFLAEKCKKCGATFTFTGNLRRHERICGKSRTGRQCFKCYRCEHTFSTGASLNAHIQHAHMNNPGTNQ